MESRSRSSVYIDNLNTKTAFKFTSDKNNNNNKKVLVYTAIDCYTSVVLQNLNERYFTRELFRRYIVGIQTNIGLSGRSTEPYVRLIFFLFELFHRVGSITVFDSF